MRHLRIRNAERQDLDRCFEIETICFPAAEAASRESIITRHQIYPRGFLVAELDGNLVGLLNSAVTDTPDLADEELKRMIGHEPDGNYVVVFSLAVDPEFQRRGISRELLETCAANAAADAKESILLLCKRQLVAFYEKMGYRNAGRSDSNHGGSAWFEMRFDLGS